MAASLAGCGGGTSPATQRTDGAFVTQIRNGSPDIGRYRSDQQLIGLGHAVCDDFSSGASYEETADRMTTTFGADTLPSEDLGTVIIAAVDNFCPRFHALVS